MIQVLVSFASHRRGGEGSLGTCARLFRALRSCQVLRVLGFEVFHELKVMLRGTLGGLRTLFGSTVLILLPVYIVSLVLRETLGRVEGAGGVREYFGTVPDAFFSTFRCIVVNECADKQGRPIFVLASKLNGWTFPIIYCGTAIFMSFGLCNLITAMFIERVLLAASSSERQRRRDRLRDKTFFAGKMTKLLQVIFELMDGRSVREWSHTSPPQFLLRVVEEADRIEITPEFFDLIRSDKRVQKIFDDLDLADADQFNLFRTLDVDNSGSIDLEELCSGIAKLRGDACRSDIISLSFMINDVKTELRSSIAFLMRRLNDHHKAHLASQRSDCGVRTRC